MSQKNYEHLMCEEVAQMALEMSPQQIQQDAPLMTLPQIATLVEILNESNDPAWRQKLFSVFAGLKETHQLEIMGKHLSLVQILELLSITTAATDIVDKHLHGKLSPLFVGLPHPIFIQVMQQATPHQLAMLKWEGITEPIQHHITLLIHEMHRELSLFAKMHEVLSKDISSLDINPIETDALKELHMKLRHSSVLALTYLDILNKALAIAWNSGRVDLVDHCNSLKEQYHRYAYVLIGVPKNGGHAQSSGLYRELEKHLSEVFGDPINPNASEALEDSDPAIEALAKLGIWYLEDYAEIGLLATLEDPTAKKKGKGKQKEGEDALVHHQAKRESLFQKAQENLKLLGLHTVEDVKKAQIYSKQMLQDYIAKHSHLIKK